MVHSLPSVATEKGLKTLSGVKKFHEEQNETGREMIEI